MCGIVAIIGVEVPVSPESLSLALGSIGHRGPDEQHIWLSKDGRTGLGHARLSIIDLKTGSQPISNEDGLAHIVVNGEFYDYQRLQRSLEARGHRLRTRSDSEVALHLYEELGRDCVHLLRGEFAFAIWDERERVLFAARDRFGIKPLFYAEHSGQLLIASEIKALFAAGLPPVWDEESVFQAVHFCPHQDRTLYRNVRQVPPGHYLMAKGGRVSLNSYWDINYPLRRDELTPTSEASCIDELGRRIEEAVRIRTRSDVPIACYLSGGVDSASVLGIAAMQTQKHISAFTVAFDHPQFDESGGAEAMAKHVGVEFHRISATQRAIADVFEEAVAQAEAPIINGHGPARYLLSRAVHQAGYKVVLGGEGADEMFAGYDFLSEALSRSTSGRPLAMARLLINLCRPLTGDLANIGRTSPLLARLVAGVGVPQDLTSVLAGNFHLLRSVLHADFLERNTRRDAYREFLSQFHFRKLIGRTPVRLLLYIWLKSHFPNYVLAGERLDMAHGVEVRLPYLDHKLFEYVRLLPGSLLFRPGRNKYLLRQTVAPFVTRQAFEGNKQPFFAPPSTADLGGPLYQLTQDLIRSKDLHTLPFFNSAGLLAFADSLKRMPWRQRASMDPILYFLASFAVLQRHIGAEGP